MLPGPLWEKLAILGLDQCSQKGLSHHSLWRFSSYEAMVPSVSDITSGEHIKGPQMSHQRETCWLCFKLCFTSPTESSSCPQLPQWPLGMPQSPLSPALDPETSRAQHRSKLKIPEMCLRHLQKGFSGREHCLPGAFSKIPFLHSPELDIWKTSKAQLLTSYRTWRDSS